MINFTKMHGLGNDYLFINCINNRFNTEKVAQNARYMCNRHFGIGADGIILINKSNVADFKMNIYNSDGSEAEMCGNGIRCFAKYVYDNKLTTKTEIKIETLCGIKEAYIIKNSNIEEITVNMGNPILDAKKIPVNLEKDDYNLKIPKITLDIENKTIDVYSISMGNPHTIMFVNEIEKIDVKKIGKFIENDRHFPEKTNVEFIKIIDRSTIKMRVWERGTGETMACGTGACAVAVLSNLLGFTRKKCKVLLMGGELNILFDEVTKNVYMTGIATKVFDGQIEELY